MRKWLACGLVAVATVRVYAATRAEYVALMQRGADAMSQSQLRTVRGPQPRPVSRYTVWYALVEAFLARHEGQTQRAAKATQILVAVNRCVLEGDSRAKVAQFAQMEFCLFDATLAYGWLSEVGALAPSERKRTEAMLIACADGVLEHKAERGAMNRAVLAGLGTAAVARLFPQATGAAVWREFADKTWLDWWSYRDTFEDASGYNALWLCGVFLQAEQMGKADRLHTTEVEALVDRFSKLRSPIGPIPDYGDAIWCGGWAFWVAIFERAAGLSGRADFRHAAEAVFRHSMRQFERGAVTRSPAQIAPLVHAWRWSREGLEPCAEPMGSLCAKRRDPYGRALWDKLVLRGGPSSNDPYVLVNLHDGGYHGHADGGALSAFVAGGSVLLHELGYHQGEEQCHNTLLVRPADEPFLFSDVPFRPGRWYTSELDLRRSYTYTGGVAPDLTRISEMFFRIDDRDDVNAAFEFAVDRIEGITREGAERPLVDLASPDAAKRWVGHSASEAATSRGVDARIEFRHADRSERAWLTRRFEPPIDVSGYARIRVRWRSGDARLDPKLGLQFGLNGVEGTQRWRISHRRTYRETVQAYVQDCGPVVYAKVTQRMVDCLGRPLAHTRELALVKRSSLLCVHDRVRIEVRGEYAIGPVWHVQNISAAGGKGFVCRDDWQWDDLTVRWASPARPVWVEMAGPPGAVAGRTEHVFREWGRTVPQRHHVYSRWVGHREPGTSVAFLSLLLPLPTAAAGPPSGVALAVSDGESVARVGDVRCTFQRHDPSGGPTTFGFVETGARPVSLSLD